MLIRRPSGTRKTLILLCFLGHCAFRVSDSLSSSLCLSLSLTLSLRDTVCTFFDSAATHTVLGAAIQETVSRRSHSYNLKTSLYVYGIWRTDKGLYVLRDENA